MATNSLVSYVLSVIEFHHIHMVRIDSVPPDIEPVIGRRCFWNNLIKSYKLQPFSSTRFRLPYHSTLGRELLSNTYNRHVLRYRNESISLAFEDLSVRFQSLKELHVGLPEREFGNCSNHFAEARLTAPTMWSPEEYDTLRICIDLTKCEVAAMALVCC